MRVALTARIDPSVPGRSALRVRLACADSDGPVMDWVWDLQQVPDLCDGGAIAGQNIAWMMSRLRRIGCRCQLDLSDLHTIVLALRAPPRSR
ncbi:MAG: hypothetical protein Q8S73_06425 [Deltaproteobacteria bacterium]|nr:hypothetical protein [Myxococcales bacterium]MDP3213718.1 hypothetical protein [Deltaproteobacteria bacterium]